MQRIAPIIILSTIVSCSLVVPPSLSLCSVASAEVFPPERAFNGMRINYTVSGATLEEPDDTDGFTKARRYKGAAHPGGTLTVSGSVTAGGGCRESFQVRVWAGNNKQEPDEVSLADGGTKPFSVSVPVPQDATSAGFSITVNLRSPYGGRTLVVSGNLGVGGAPTQPPPADFTPPEPTPGATITAEEALKQILTHYNALPHGPYTHLGEGAGPAVNLVASYDNTYYDWVCGAWQVRALDMLKGLHQGSPRQRAIFDHYDYGPAQILGGAHQFVVIWPKGTDWKKTGIVLDGWWTQQPRSWTVKGYSDHFGLGLPEPSAVYKGQYPLTGGSTYTNLDTLTTPEEHRLIIERLSQEERDAYFAYEYAQDRQRFIDALPPHLKKSVAVAVHSPVRMLIIDSRGRRVGFTDQNTFVYEIPGATGAVVPEGDRGHGMVLLLPLELDHYLVQITGQAHGSFGFSRSMPRSIASNALLHQNQMSVQPGQTFTYILSPRTPDAPLMGSDGRVTQLAPATISDIHGGGLTGEPRPTPPPTPISVPNLSGEWSFNGNNYRTTLILQHEGDRLSGTLYGVPMEDGRALDDGTVTFIRTGVNQTYTGRFSVEPDGTWKLSGTFDCPVTRTTGSLWVATRDPRGGEAPTPTLPDRETVSTPPAPTPAPTPEPTPPALPDLPSPIDAIVGEWSVVMAMLDGPQPTTLSVERDGDGVVGTLDDRINAWLRLRAAGAGNDYTGTWTDPQAGTVAVTASITPNGALIVKLVEGTGGWDVLFNAIRPRGGTGTAPAAPAATQPGTSSVEELLVAGGLHHSPRREGGYTVPFDNDVKIVVDQIGGALLAYHHIGQLPGNNATERGDWALEALRLNFSDTVGRMSLLQGNDGSLELYWSCRVPLSAATGPYVKAITATGASQVERWRAVQRNEEPPDLSSPIPAGDREELFERLKRQSHAAGLQFKEDGDRDVLRYDGNLVSASIFVGTAWLFGFSGGMPGGTDAGWGATALELLMRNWDDPVGRFSLDSDYDLLWECQVPMDYLTPDLLKYVHDTGAEQLDSIIRKYGRVPFNG